MNDSAPMGFGEQGNIANLKWGTNLVSGCRVLVYAAGAKNWLTVSKVVVFLG